jgi:hypothetical protein
LEGFSKNYGIIFLSKNFSGNFKVIFLAGGFSREGITDFLQLLFPVVAKSPF